MIIDKCYKIDIKLHKIRCLYNLHYLFSKNKTNPLRDISTFVVQYTSDAIWNNAIGDFEFKNMKQKKKKIYEWIVKYRVYFADPLNNIFPTLVWWLFFMLMFVRSAKWNKKDVKYPLGISLFLVDTVLIFCSSIILSMYWLRNM